MYSIIRKFFCTRAHCVSHRAQCESHRGARVPKKLPYYRVDSVRRSWIAGLMEDIYGRFCQQMRDTTPLQIWWKFEL
jgi:hypothetical protein